MTQYGDPKKFHLHLLMLISWDASMEHVGLPGARSGVGAGSSDDMVWGWRWEGREQNWNIFIVPRCSSASFCRCLQGYILSSLIPAPKGGISLPPLCTSFTFHAVWVCGLLLGRRGRVHPDPHPQGNSGSGTLWSGKATEASLRLLALTSSLRPRAAPRQPPPSPRLPPQALGWPP